MDITTLIIMLLKIIVIFIAMLLGVAYLTWLERKVLGHMQIRYGPMRTGWHGLLQPIADGIKLVFKEDIVVDNANKFIYTISPFIVAVCAFASFAVVPFGYELTLFGRTIPLRIADVNIGILYVFALSSLSVYGVTLAGWSSNNKYAMMGGLRSSMGYVGCKDLDEMRTKPEFVRISGAGMSESHVHDVTITKEAPNYRSS